MFQLYRVFYAACYLLAKCLAPFHSKIKSGWKGREGLIRRIQSLNLDQPIWFHFASSGEFEQCIPILEKIKSQFNKPIFLSYFSPSAEKAVALEKKRRAQSGLPICWDASDYCPFDLPKFVKPYVQALNPSHFVAIHREIWPVLLTELQSRSIPRYLFVAHVSKKTFWVSHFYRKWLKLFDFIGTTNEQSCQYLQALLKETPPKKVKTVGDPRIERVLSRKERTQKRFNTFFEGRPVFLLGSVWPNDFEQTKDALLWLFSARPEWRIVIAPHQCHPAFEEKLRRFFLRQQRPCELWSEWQHKPNSKSDLIVNTIGDLAELYTYARLVFIGGSFKSKVHNVLEPAAHGKPIFTGPKIKNSAEAMDLSQTDSGIVVIHSGKQLLFEIENLFQNPKRYGELSKRLLLYLNHRRGTAEKYLQILNRDGPLGEAYRA